MTHPSIRPVVRILSRLQTWHLAARRRAEDRVLLRAMSGRDLQDLGIGAGEIEAALRAIQADAARSPASQPSAGSRSGLAWGRK